MDTAGEVVTAYLRGQEKVVRRRADDVRDLRRDAVHRSRVASRRARSVLRTYAPVFRGGVRKDLRRDLRWYGRTLGPLRDAEVLRAWLLEALDEMSEEDVDAVARGRIEAALADRHARAHDQVSSALDTPRFERLTARFAAFVDEPPLRKPGRRSAKKVLPNQWATAVAKVSDRAEAAEADPTDLRRWHEVRKAAKAARYGSEALKPVTKAAKAHAKSWEKVTDALGIVQDTVVAEEGLAALQRAAAAAGEPTRTYAILIEHEHSRRSEFLATGRSALEAALGLPPL